MKAETLKRQGWSICPETRFLSYKPIDKSYDITYISYIEDKELQLIYVVLGLDLGILLVKMIWLIEIINILKRRTDSIGDISFLSL